MPCDGLFEEYGTFETLVLSMLRTGDVPDEYKTEENAPAIEHIKEHIDFGWETGDLRFDKLIFGEELFPNISKFGNTKSEI